MKRNIILCILLASSSLVLSNCIEENDDTFAVQDSIDKFYKSISEDDIETRITLLADDVILMPNNWTVVKGKEKVSESYRNTSSWVFRIKDREVLRLEVSGELAYTINSYHYSWHAKGDEPQWHKTKNVHVWRRDKNGNWKLTVDIWNSDVQITKFNEE